MYIKRALASDMKRSITRAGTEEPRLFRVKHLKIERKHIFNKMPLPRSSSTEMLTALIGVKRVSQFGGPFQYAQSDLIQRKVAIILRDTFLAEPLFAN